MLENTPSIVGRALQGVRAGPEHLSYNGPDFQAPERLSLLSPAFAPGGALPARYTEDGDKISPPLTFSGVPAEAKSLIVVIEDPDAPTPLPIIHTLALGPASSDGRIEEGALCPPASGSQLSAGPLAWTLGRNSFNKLGYLPPDPPTGHGPHTYVFQLFALDTVPVLEPGWSKSDLLKAVKGAVIARGRLDAVYGRPD